MPSVPPTGRLLRLIRPSSLSARTFSTSKCRLEQIHGADEAVCQGRASALSAARVLSLMLVLRHLTGCQLPREQMSGWLLSIFMQSASLAAMIRSVIDALMYHVHSWCGPCKTLSPILQKLASDADVRTGLGRPIDLITVDTDKHSALAQKYGVRPTFSVARLTPKRDVG
jgi:thiol-disulfide isomerase/thioredoxin